MLYENEVRITGNLGKDAETTTVKSGRTVTRFSIANTKRYKTSEGKQVEKTTWVRVAAWGSLGSYAAQLRKGDPVLITGELEISEFVGDDKVKRQNHEIIARAIYKIDFTKPAATDENPDADSNPDE